MSAQDTPGWTSAEVPRPVPRQHDGSLTQARRTGFTQSRQGVLNTELYPVGTGRCLRPTPPTTRRNAFQRQVLAPPTAPQVVRGGPLPYGGAPRQPGPCCGCQGARSFLFLGRVGAVVLDPGHSKGVRALHEVAIDDRVQVDVEGIPEFGQQAAILHTVQPLEFVRHPLRCGKERGQITLGNL